MVGIVCVHRPPPCTMVQCLGQGNATCNGSPTDGNGGLARLLLFSSNDTSCGLLDTSGGGGTEDTKETGRRGGNEAGARRGCSCLQRRGQTLCTGSGWQKREGTRGLPGGNRSEGRQAVPEALGPGLLPCPEAPCPEAAASTRTGANSLSSYYSLMAIPVGGRGESFPFQRACGPAAARGRGARRAQCR